MEFTNTAKTLLVLVAILAAVYLLFGQSNLMNFSKPQEKERVVEEMEVDSEREADSEREVDSEMEEENNLPEEMSEESEETMVAKTEDPMARKFRSRNSGTNVKHSYAENPRGQVGPSDWDNYFDENNNVIAAGLEGSNDRFAPNASDDGNFAAFKGDGKLKPGQEIDPEDLFDSNNYLPKEHRDDWYEVMPEPVSVKNRNLINVTRPIGVNTISTTKKNASYDIRGAPSCPKYVVSPFLNSSIEPDINLDPKRALL